MTEEESKRDFLDNILHAKYTDDDFLIENDVEKLQKMTINWKEIQGKWSNVAERKMREVATRENLTMHEKVLLWQLGYYKAKTPEDKKKFDEVEAIQKDFEEFLKNEGAKLLENRKKR